MRPFPDRMDNSIIFDWTCIHIGEFIIVFDETTNHLHNYFSARICLVPREQFQSTAPSSSTAIPPRLQRCVTPNDSIHCEATASKKDQRRHNGPVYLNKTCMLRVDRLASFPYLFVVQHWTRPRRSMRRPAIRSPAGWVVAAIVAGAGAVVLREGGLRPLDPVAREDAALAKGAPASCSAGEAAGGADTVLCLGA